MDPIIIERIWKQGTPVQVDNLSGTAFTGEAQAHTFRISGQDSSGEALSITGAITAKFITSTQVVVPLTGSIDSGAAVVTLTSECYAVPGNFVFAIYATNGSVTQCIYACVGNVFRTSAGSAAYPTAAIPDLVTLVNAVQAAIASVPSDYTALMAGVANIFDTSTNYLAGKYIWYNGTLYRFTSDHAAGNWTGTDAVAVAMGNDLDTALNHSSVRYDASQTLSAGQQGTARANIDAVSTSELAAVGTVLQTKSDQTRAMIASAEASATAAAAHAVGSYFTYNNLLYRATAAIAVGDTITPGTNCTAVSAGADIADLKSALNNTILFTDNKLDLDAISTHPAVETKSVTDYIKCEKSYVALTFIGRTGYRTQASGTVYNFYNANKNYITAVTSNATRAAVEIPDNCAYVRAILNTENFDISKAPMVTFFDTQVSTYTDLIYERFGTAWFKYPKYDIPAINDEIDAINDEIDAINDEINTNICGCTWDWWISSIAKDKYGNIYIGYVDENGSIGVLQKKTDGICTYKTLGPTQNNDDHNGAAVIVLNSGRVLVVSSSGHSYDNTIRIYRSTSSYSVNCKFENLSVKLRQPTNTLYKTTYAQIFKDDINDVETLSVLFRCVVSENGMTSATTYPVLRSTDGGSTWVLYKGFRKNDLYAKIVNTRTIGLKRIYATSNPVRSANAIVTGLIDFAAMAVKDSVGATLYNLTEVANGIDDGTEAEAGSLIEGLESIANLFSRVVNTSDDIRLRLLDAMEYAASSAIYCVYAKSKDTEYTNYSYYVNIDGTEIEIGESGLPFYLYSSYLPGCAIESTETVYYAKNDSGVQDGAHSLHKVTIDNGRVSSDEIVMRSESLLVRPIYINYTIAILGGLYNDISAVGTTGSFRLWNLAPYFMRVT